MFWHFRNTTFYPRGILISGVYRWSQSVWGVPYKVPISVNDITGQGVRSFVVQITFDPNRVGPGSPAYEAYGTLSSGMIVTTNIPEPGHLIISATSPTDLAGSGTLIYLRFAGGGPPGLGAGLFFQDYVDPEMNFHPGFRFNDGTPAAITTNGGLQFFRPIQATQTPTPTPSATPSPTVTPCDLTFDLVSAPVLPGNWSSSYVPWQNIGNYYWSQWVNSTTDPDTPPNAAFAPDPWGRETMYLRSPNYFVPPSEGGVFSFRNFYDTEPSFDGMVLDISIDGGSSQDIVTAGGQFLSGGYNSTIGTGYQSSLEGRNAWSGNSGGYITTTVQLPQHAIGSWISLTWTMASDNSVPGNGVKIDTITGLQCFGETTPTPTETPSPTPTGTPGHSSITVGTNPAGLSFTVDSVTYTSTVNFIWLHGTTHTLSTTSPQSSGADTRYLWNNWSTGGAMSHTTNTPMVSDSIRANFTTQYLLTMFDAPLFAKPSTGFYDAGQSVQITATPPAGCIFHHWTGIGNGSYSGSANPATVVMNGPITEQAFWSCPPSPTATPTPARTMAFDYDGDGRSDISVFRPTEGNWYLQQSTDGFYGVNFGLSADKIVPADYDGDGKTDVAVYRPSEGNWYSLNSSNGTFTAMNFGIAEDRPAPADYDGDGRADLAVFRPSDRRWYITNSSNGTFTFRYFDISLPSDIPTIGDFDGDGRSDIAMVNNSSTWYRFNSSTGQYYLELFGQSGDKVAPADYDGDGKTDLAVYRPSSGNWHIKNSSDGSFTAFNFGLADDIPAPGDFDGDGKADIAVFRPSDGIWYIANSSNGSYSYYQFGLSGDRPTQSAFGN